MKLVIYFLALVAIGVCVIILGTFVSGNAGIFWPLLMGVFLTAIPFLYALYQGILLLRSIERNIAFSDASVTQIKTIEYCAFAISVLYALMMPFIIYLADLDDAPGAAVLGLMCIISPLVVGVFAAVLQRLFQSAIELKSENDLTV